MPARVDVLLITAAEGEDDATRLVDTGARGPWTKIPGPDGYGFPIWRREYDTPNGQPLTIALTRAFQMGVEASGNAAAQLTAFFHPRCLAMCGVCAGRPDWTNLGDVIVADRLWRYDVAELLNATPGAKPQFHPDVLQYPFRPQWTQAAQRFELPTRDDLLALRPRPRELQGLWLLKQLLDGADPLAQTDRAAMCADWKDVVGDLKRRKLVRMKGGAPVLTKTGTEFIQNTLYEHAGQLPAQPDWKIHVGPFGTGSSLVRDVDIWSFLENQQRKVCGFDMEASVVGLTALVQDVPRMIVVKGVMDYGGPDRNYGFRPFAARAAAEVLIAFLREHLKPGTPQILVPNTAQLPSDPSPATLLNARYETVQFTRDACSAVWNDLQSWCDAADLVSVRLIVGPGGIGKTRLFIELAARLRDRGWQAGFWPEGATPDDVVALLASSVPTLMVIDYAETRPELLETLKAVARRPDGAPLRVVLLAREVADWWHSLLKQDAAVADLLMRQPPTAVQAISLDDPLRKLLFEQARLCFADLRQQPVPPGPVDLRDDRFGRPLYLQMAALAVVDGLDPAADALLDGIVTHEQHFWARRFASENPNDHFTQTEFLEGAARSMAAFTLRGGAATSEQAQAINEHASGARHSQWVRFLESLYPGRPTEAGAARYLAALEPDLLGEQLVARVLADTHTAASYLLDVFTDNDPEALRQAFVVLGRISLRDGRALGWMERLLTADVSGRAPAAFLAAMTLGGLSAFAELGRILAAHLEKGGTAQVAAFIDRIAPQQTVSLLELCVWATGRLLQTLPANQTSEKIRTERARLLGNHGARLSALGRRGEALAAAREAVEIRRNLVAARPRAFLPDLALSLNNLGNALSESGDRKEAFAATREAVEIRRALVTANPDAFLPDLALSLGNLGHRLSDLGRREEALAAAREALEHYRKLAARHPGAFLPDLAMSLNNLATSLAELNRRDEALAPGGEAVELYRQLAAVRPDAFLPDLAMSLNNLGANLAQLNRPVEALVPAREAMEHYRQLAAARPLAFLQDLAMSLNNLGSMLSELGRREEAFAATREAVEQYRELAAARPDAFLPYLALSLSNLGAMLSALARWEEALAAAREAVGLYLKVTASLPGRYLRECVIAARGLAKRCEESGLDEHAEPLLAEAVALIYRLTPPPGSTEHADD